MATWTLTPGGDVVLCLTPAEARGLSVLAGEGAEGMLTDAMAARDYIGGPAAVAAARRAVDALGAASHRARGPATGGGNG